MRQTVGIKPLKSWNFNRKYLLEQVLADLFYWHFNKIYIGIGSDVVGNSKKKI